MKTLKKIITKKFINHLAFASNFAVFISSFFFQNYIYVVILYSIFLLITIICKLIIKDTKKILYSICF